MELHGNTILITGGSSGIGLGLAEELNKLGNNVIICGRRIDKLNEVTKKNPAIITKCADISIDSERRELVTWVLSNYPDTNVLINNAGVQTGQAINSTLDLQKLHQEIDTNVTAPIHLCALMTDHLKTKPKATIINISSGLAFAPLAFIPIYCATKAAVHSFSLSLRHLLKDTSIRVFEIAPPAVDTELGHDRRTDKTQSHGGISVAEFLAESMEALKNDEYEAAIGTAKGLREKRELLFNVMNK